MKKLLLLFSLFYCAPSFSALGCQGWASWFKPACERIHQIFTEGDGEIYLSGYAWHNRFTYSEEKLKTYNEAAWGGGLGKGLYDEKGNWHGVYSFAFLDSHKNVEPIAGYAYLKMFDVTENSKIGAGVSAFVTARPDIFQGIPFPGALPWLSLNYRKTALGITYIPGAQGAGNVLFLILKITM
ncbi:Rcp protein, confers resistance to cationic antimicrobial peptides and promotes intracellular infection (plasmid) [Legionella adelaidensis]|uniref:Antimicrobial peptide resistance and lipid A acylation PagP n=1 Tax=Legionella adelaidensis TaxID=45056 RepID=A0A0W0R1B9_9GAMM|nr:lipid IV(A) palmitoyltransferase PagP [Legionella adelaidensis]KTC64866.1 antimicrobial peptide resistance and lipid A acylation PagP [Legionella adelaidensis]VEH82963.1 Rcp protein, confers resistance to cationic antimicrobial peptides and promotes intracellular infection [Legionella adelaidensis]